MYKYEAERFINAGENEIYRYGKKAQTKVESYKAEHNGYYSIPVDGEKYWTFGTSTGKYGEFIKYGETLFSVNNSGYAYAKAGTEKGEKFLAMLDDMLRKMNELNMARFSHNDDEEDE